MDCHDSDSCNHVLIRLCKLIPALHPWAGFTSSSVSRYHCSVTYYIICSHSWLAMDGLPRMTLHICDLLCHFLIPHLVHLHPPVQKTISPDHVPVVPVLVKLFSPLFVFLSLGQVQADRYFLVSILLGV